MFPTDESCLYLRYEERERTRSAYQIADNW